MRRRAAILGLLVSGLVSSCARPPAQPVVDLGGSQDVSHYELTALKGTRNGDQLDLLAVYGGPDDHLSVELHFQVTPPTHLTSGTWTGLGLGGSVHERASKFLGGQSGPPSLGGTFDLLGPANQPLFRVTIPLQPLKIAY